MQRFTGHTITRGFDGSLFQLYEHEGFQMRGLNCLYATDALDTMTASGNVHKARSLIQSKAQFRHAAQNRFFNEYVHPFKRTLVQGRSKLWGGQLPLCADLWAILLHFDLSSDDGAAGTDSGVEGLGTGGTRRVTASFVFVLSSFWAWR